MKITTAMLLAAGLGTRMKPLTDTLPKPMIEVAGRTLIDRVLDKLVAQGVTRAIVNVHYLADLMEAHLRTRKDIEIVISDERAQLMETGGGIRQARPLLGDDPIIVCNIDSVWEEWNGSALTRLAYSFNPAKSSAKLMLAQMDQCLGFEGAGDFFMDEGGKLSFRDDAPSAPWAYTGAQIIDPRIVDEEPLEPFGFMRIWRRLQSEGRLHGAPLGGFWMHVGDPQAREQAEARLARAA